MTLQRQKGFTMVELLITVGIFAVLVAFALPTMVRTKNKTNFNSEVRAVVETLQEARTNAVIQKRARTVTIEPSKVQFTPAPVNRPDAEIELEHLTISPAVNLTYDYMGRVDVSGANRATDLQGHCFALTHSEDPTIVASILVQSTGNPNIFKNSNNCQ